MNNIVLTDEQFKQLLETVKGPTNTLCANPYPTEQPKEEREANQIRMFASEILNTSLRYFSGFGEKFEKYDAFRKQIIDMCKEHI